jgi:hypothetical protein
MLNLHTSRASQLWLAILLFALSLLLIATSCGGRRTIAQHGTPGTLAVDDAVSQALAMQPPSGVDPAVFNKLRDELVRQLRLKADGKLTSSAPAGDGGKVTDLSYDAVSGNLTWSYTNDGDYNLDGSVGVADITPIAAHFGANTTDGVGDDALEAWIDGSGNGVVDISDITPLAMGFGSEVVYYGVMVNNSLVGEFARRAQAWFINRDTSTVPPTFTYPDFSLAADHTYCKVQPFDHAEIAGIDSLVLNLVTGSAIITEGTIGPEGGILDGGDVTVEVEEDGFSADTPLSIATSPAGRYEDQASDGFYIDGVPDTFNQPITISLKMNEPPGPDGEPVLAMEEGDVMVYGSPAAPGREARYFQGTYDDGWFTATIPATENDLGTSSLRGVSEILDHRIYVTVINRRHYMMSNGGRFLVYYPAGDEALAGTVCDTLDNAYAQIETTVGMSWARRTTWPLEVTIRIMSGDAFDGEMVTSRFWGVNGATITINSTNMTNDDIAKATAGHELMHVAQYLYDKRNRVASSWSGGGWIWMDDATATWFEKRMTSSSFIPSTVAANVGFLQAPLATDNNEHGYGASMFMTYMAQKQGNSVIGDVSKMKWDNYQPIDALKSKTSSLISIDWHLFCEKYMKLGVYGANTYPASGTINSLQQGGHVFGDDPSTWTATLTYANAPDLSARIYRIQFGPFSNWADTDDMAITFYGNDPDTAPQDAYYIVCTYASSTYKFVCGSSEHEYLVKDLKSIATGNGAVYIMVVNSSATSPYTGNRAEPINLKVERKEDFLKRLQLNHSLDLRASCGDVLYSTTEPRSFRSYFSGDYGFNSITWEGTSFYSDHEAINPGDDYYIDGTVDVENRTVTCTYTFHNAANGSTADTVYTLTSLPIHSGENESSPYDYYPRVTGLAWGADCLTYINGVASGGHTKLTGPPVVEYDWSLSDFLWAGGPPSGDYILTRFWIGF